MSACFFQASPNAFEALFWERHRMSPDTDSAHTYGRWQPFHPSHRYWQPPRQRSRGTTKPRVSTPLNTWRGVKDRLKCSHDHGSSAPLPTKPDLGMSNGQYYPSRDARLLPLAPQFPTPLGKLKLPQTTLESLSLLEAGQEDLASMKKTTRFIFYYSSLNS